MRRIQNIVEPEFRAIENIVLMADRTMEELLQAPTRENDNPLTHISNFKRMTATLKYRDVLNDAIKLMLFPYSLEDRARIWACPHHGFSELTQIDMFYNSLTEQDQDSLNAVAGGNLLNKTTREALKIIENKSKVRYSRNKSNVARVNTNSKDNINVLGGDFSKQEENLRRNLNDDMRNILSSFFQNQHSTSGTLPSNTIPNPKGEMKAVTIRSGLEYEGPSIPTESPLEKVDEQNTKEISDKERFNSSGSTAQVQPLVVPISILEPNVLRTQKKPTIPYPSSFADALLLMPKFASTIKSLLANKDKLFKLAKVPLNENCSAMLLKKLPEKLGDPDKFLIPCDFQGMEVGKFHFLNDFIVVDFEANQRVPLILGMSFLRTSHALIDVYGEEITLRYNPKISNPTLVYDDLIFDSDANKVPIVKSSSPTLTPFGQSDFFHEEIEDFLNDDSIPIGVKNFVYDPEGDILFLEKLLNEDPFQLPLMDLKLVEESKKKSFVKEPPELELKELSSHLEPMTHLLEKEKPFVFSKECIEAFNTLKKKLTEALILVIPDWNLPFELMYDASDYAIERTVGENCTSWSDKLDDALWAFRTAYKTQIGSTPYKLVYGKSCHLLIELEHRAYWALKHVNFDLKTTGDHRKLQLNELSELCDQAYENSVIYKERKKKLHDSKIKNRIFNVGDQVLLFNSRLKIFSGKLKPVGLAFLPSPVSFLTFDYLDEYYGPFIPIHILEEERIRREHTDYINQMEMLFTINQHPHPLTYANMNVESFFSLPIPIKDSDPHQEEIDVVAVTDDVLPPSIKNDDSDEEVYAVDVLRVDNFIQNSEHEYSESEDSDFDNPPVPLPPPKPPDEEFDFEIDFRNEIYV
nr:reverse transcriptase domain-containing protein [Tanacetum cinerariifolium]